MGRVEKTTIITIAMLAASGCSSMLTSDAPPDTTYWLEPAPITSSAGPDTDKPSIRVTVTAIPGLDVDRILVLGPGSTLTAYTAARWVDNIPDVVETLVRAALEDSGRFGPVVSARTAARTAWGLDLEVRAFHAVAQTGSGPPSVELQLRGYLRCPAQVRAVRVQSRQGARTNTLSEITAAFQAVVDEGLVALVDQLPTDCGD